MWPIFLLGENLKGSWIFLHHCIHHSFVLEEIERTSGVYHLTTYLQCMERSIEKAFLESCDLLDVLQVPVFHCISTLIEGSFSTTWRIEKDAIESFREIFPVLSRIESNSYIWCMHTLKVLEELGDTFTSRFIRDDE